MTQGQREQQNALHTPTPWERADPDEEYQSGDSWCVPIFAPNARFFDRTPVVVSAVNKMNARPTADLVRCSVNSYARHFGPRAVEAAESDLLGQAMEALEQIILHGQRRRTHDPGTAGAFVVDEFVVDDLSVIDDARAILAKRDAAAQEPTP